eukprot:UN14729
MNRADCNAPVSNGDGSTKVVRAIQGCKLGYFFILIPIILSKYECASTHVMIMREPAVRRTNLKNYEIKYNLFSHNFSFSI